MIIKSGQSKSRKMRSITEQPDGGATSLDSSILLYSIFPSGFLVVVAIYIMINCMDRRMKAGTATDSSRNTVLLKVKPKKKNKNGRKAQKSRKLPELPNQWQVDENGMSEPPAVLVSMIKNSKTIVQLAIRTVNEMSYTSDPITADLRNVADLHLAEIAEAWTEVIGSDNLKHIIILTNFIESKCVVINDLHNTYITYMTMKKATTPTTLKTGSRKGLCLASNEEIITEDEEDIYNKFGAEGLIGRGVKVKPTISRDSARSKVSESASNIAKRHKSRLKSITQKLKSHENKDPKYKSTDYWKKKVDKMLERTNDNHDTGDYDTLPVMAEAASPLWSNHSGREFTAGWEV